MSLTRSMARGLVIGVAAVSIGLVAGTAFAAAGGTGHTVSMTEHQHGTFEDDGATNPCTGVPGVAVFGGNVVEHVTFFPAGDEEWATFADRQGQRDMAWSDLRWARHRMGQLQYERAEREHDVHPQHPCLRPGRFQRDGT
jgi:hypothetical protein